MVKINDIEYKVKNISIDYGTFSISYLQDGVRKHRKGISPQIYFYFDNKKYLFVETTCPLEYLKELKIDTKIDFEKYISDFDYDIGLGWVTLAGTKCTSYITKISDNRIKLYLSIKDTEFKNTFLIDEEIESDLNGKISRN